MAELLAKREQRELEMKPPDMVLAGWRRMRDELPPEDVEVAVVWDDGSWGFAMPVRLDEDDAWEPANIDWLDNDGSVLGDVVWWTAISA